MNKTISKSNIPALTTEIGDLAGIPEEQLTEIHAQLNTRAYQKGQILFYEGNRAFGLHYLNSGKVKLYKFTPDGRSYISRIVQAGELMGCHAYFTGDTYSLSAEVLETASVCFIEHNDVKKLLEQNPLFALQLLNKMSQRLRTAESKAADMAYKSVPERLADLLLNLCDSFGKPEENGRMRIELSLSREDLASLLGTTVETVVRTLTRFRQLELIGTEKKRLVLTNLPRLSEMAA